MSTTTDPTPEQWTEEQVREAFSQGREEEIVAARYAGLLDAVLNPTKEA